MFYRIKTRYITTHLTLVDFVIGMTVKITITFLEPCSLCIYLADDFDNMRA